MITQCSNQLTHTSTEGQTDTTCNFITYFHHTHLVYMHASAFQEVCNRFPMQICKSSTPVHQHVRLKRHSCLKFSKSATSLRTETGEMPVAPVQQKEPCYDLALRAREASANLWDGGSVNQGHCRSQSHIKPVNVSFGFKASVTIKAWALKKRITPVLLMRYNSSPKTIWK